jgi:hypothetical protein
LGYYRWLLLKKKGRDKIIASVRESILRNNVTRLRVQKCKKGKEICYRLSCPLANEGGSH